MVSSGTLARALRINPSETDWSERSDILLVGGVPKSRYAGLQKSGVAPFMSAGVMLERQAWTRSLGPHFRGRARVLRDVLERADSVPDGFFVAHGTLSQWKEAKRGGAKEREAKNGHRYAYVEGAIPFPDPIDRPARTILTGEGGSTPSRFKHIIRAENGKYRRLTPSELERLTGFPPGWTDTGMPDGQRAFMMGNAVVVGLVEKIGQSLRIELHSIQGVRRTQKALRESGHGENQTESSEASSG